MMSWADGSAEQRERYVQARVAIALGDEATATALGPELNRYPLFPYYRYEALRARLDGGVEQVAKPGQLAHGHIDRVIHGVDLFA